MTTSASPSSPTTDAPSAAEPATGQEGARRAKPRRRRARKCKGCGNERLLTPANEAKLLRDGIQTFVAQQIHAGKVSVDGIGFLFGAAQGALWALEGYCDRRCAEANGAGVVDPWPLPLALEMSLPTTRPCEPAHRAAQASEAAFRERMERVEEWPASVVELGYRLLQGHCPSCRTTLAIELPAEAPATEATC